MKKVLIILLVVLLVAAAGVGGFLWYRNTHIFVEDAAYPKSAQVLDLRGTEISVEHYESVHAQLPDCQVLWDVPFQGKSYSNDITSLTVTALTDEDLNMLKYFPKLKTVDASGCSDYTRLEALQTRYPDCTVSYQVTVGGKSFAPDVTELTLETGDYDYDVLLENLQHLPAVTKITFVKTEQPREKLEAISAAYEYNIAVDYTVELLGTEYDSQTTELDLSAMTSDDVETVTGKLAMLENVTSVELMDAEGASALTVADVKALKEAAPAAAFHYSFEYFGVTISTTDTEVKLTNKKIGEDGVEEVRQILDILDNCERFVLDNCRISDETMAQLREDYRDRTKIVWRVWFSKGSSLTDAEVIRAVYYVTDKNAADLVYCEDVRYVDFGHDDTLKDFSFIAGMKNLEAAIISGSSITDLTPFASCENLKFLEIANCTYVEDLSPLTNCKQLEMLNISFTHVTDLSPLDELNLTHLTAVTNRIPTEEEERFAEKFPDCWVNFKKSDVCYGTGWRYDSDGNKLEWYAKLAEAFRYPDAPNWTGWYL